MDQLTLLLQRAECTVSDAAAVCRAWENGSEPAPANRWPFLWEAAEACDDVIEAVGGIYFTRTIDRYPPKSRVEFLALAAWSLVSAAKEKNGRSEEFEMAAQALGIATNLSVNLPVHKSYNSEAHIMRARTPIGDRDSMPLVDALYAHAGGGDDFIMQPEDEIDLYKILLPTKIRRNLQSKWWAALVSKPESHLHRHIKPGRFMKFGQSGDERECLLVLGLSLHYFVWHTDCYVRLYVDDGNDRRGATGGPSSWERAVFQRLFAHRDAIEASFGAELAWNEVGDIEFSLDGGFMSPDREWDEIIDRQVDAMNRLHGAFTPHLSILPKLGSRLII